MDSAHHKFKFRDVSDGGNTNDIIINVRNEQQVFCLKASPSNFLLLAG